MKGISCGECVVNISSHVGVRISNVMQGVKYGPEFRAEEEYHKVIRSIMPYPKK